jgi:hypothetical protein
MLATITAASDASTPSQNFLIILMACVLRMSCPRRVGSSDAILGQGVRSFQNASTVTR